MFRGHVTIRQAEKRVRMVEWLEDREPGGVCPHPQMAQYKRREMAGHHDILIRNIYLRGLKGALLRIQNQ